MDVIRTMKPGNPGTRRFQKYWGNKLVAVRYRRKDRTLFTTIEIIVDERLQPQPGISLNSVHAYERKKVVAVRIAFEEKAIRAAAIRCGARWSQKYKVWLMPYDTAVALGIHDRVVKGLAEKCAEIELFDG